ncbi:MAG: hypothetical protein WC050_02150 [Candidatus Paceibacterota bacterium]
MYEGTGISVAKLKETRLMATKNSGRARKALTLDKQHVAAAVGLVEKVALKQAARGLDFGPVHRLAAHIKTIAGKTLAEFRQLNESVIAELREAATFVDRKYRKIEHLHDFLRGISAVLHMAIDKIAAHAGRVAVFLIALIDPKRASDVRVMYLRA